jgi:hypothetical protein
MKYIFFIVFPIVTLFFTGCVPATQYQQHKPSVQHQYNLSFIDVNDVPLKGVNVEYEIKNTNNIVEKKLFVTSDDGLFEKKLLVYSDSKYTYITDYSSSLKYKAEKSGYYGKSGFFYSKYGDEYSLFKPIEKEIVTLIRPTDYFDKQFLTTLTDTQLKERVLSFIDLIILQGLVSESVLETQSINLVQFKNDEYLQFKFNNVNVYNSLKLDKYDIGKKLFDDVIRKVLSPLNEHIGNSNLFYGYDITVVGHTKSFAEEYASAKPIEYRFIIPETAVKKYKDKDITGQNILDLSTILMDDERVELKLQ